MDISETIQLAGIVVTGLIGAGGFGGVVYTLKKNVEIANRAEWWKRYTWAEEQCQSENAEIVELGWAHLEILSTSPLATDSEAKVIGIMALEYSVSYDGNREEEGLQNEQESN